MKFSSFNQFSVLRAPDDGQGGQGGGGGQQGQQGQQGAQGGQQGAQGGDGGQGGQQGGQGDGGQQGGQQGQQGAVNDQTVKPLFDENGKLTGNWKENANLSGFDFAKFEGKTAEEILKSTGNAEKLIASKGGVHKVPEVFDPKDPAFAAYKLANGIPDDPQAYVFRPDAQLMEKYGMKPEDFNEAEALGMAKIALKYGLTPAQAKGAAAEIQELQLQDYRRQVEENNNELHQAEQTLRAKWGGKYQENMDLVKRLVVSRGHSLDAPGLRDPATVATLYDITTMMGPAALQHLMGTKGPNGGFASGRDEAHAIMTDKNHPDHEAYRNGEKWASEKVARLLS